MRTLTFNRVIGVGAMGTVYHAELRAPRGFTRTCAVKVLKSAHPGYDHFRSRVRDEARLLGMLQDELILGVSELVEVAGCDAVIMDYVDGVDLAHVVRNGSVPPKALAELGADIAGTLHRAHTARHPTTREPLHVIHRDIKPANLMVTRRGGSRVLDFGVARAVFATRESQTRGLVLGTLNYFAPEILRGAPPSPGVDIYGLGLTLWECAMGAHWGAPRVQRAPFERRVEERLSRLPIGYAPLIPVLRRVLVWDPAVRPDGGELEAVLLDASRRCRGQSLGEWSRRTVPGLVVAAARRCADQVDELLGRTLPVSEEILSSPSRPGGKAAGLPTFRVESEASVETSSSRGARDDSGEERTLPLEEARGRTKLSNARSAASTRTLRRELARSELVRMVWIGLMLGGGVGVMVLFVLRMVMRWSG